MLSSNVFFPIVCIMILLGCLPPKVVPIFPPQWRNCNFWAPGKHSLRALVLVLIHNSGHFGPLYRFGPLGPPAIGIAMRDIRLLSERRHHCLLNSTKIVLCNILFGERDTYVNNLPKVVT